MDRSELLQSLDYLGPDGWTDYCPRCGEVAQEDSSGFYCPSCGREWSSLEEWLEKG